MAARLREGMMLVVGKGNRKRSYKYTYLHRTPPIVISRQCSRAGRADRFLCELEEADPGGAVWRPSSGHTKVVERASASRTQISRKICSASARVRLARGEDPGYGRRFGKIRGAMA